ncbi:hypothetical protein HCN44_004677 [Aphidius gifuensis]|uniref:Uncharacterized protein n=1 Tax=Aphidius gifuensis TaxID=684658 RepID=A0A834XX91_APHGI|nr:hypothetical protein HCN44_004677 [Aphidius gifuensis]
MGIDGGLLMTIHDRKNKQAHFLNAKDKAPLEKNMFKVTGKESSKCGSLAIGVPVVTNSLNRKKLFISNLPGNGELLVLTSRDQDFTDMTDSLKNITSKDFARNIKDKVDDERTWNESSHYIWANNLLKNHGISQASVIAPNSDAVVVTSRVVLMVKSQDYNPTTHLKLDSDNYLENLLKQDLTI